MRQKETLELLTDMVLIFAANLAQNVRVDLPAVPLTKPMVKP